MQEYGGYIRLNRHIVDCAWYQVPYASGLMLHLLLCADLGGNVQKPIRRICRELGYTAQQFVTALELLQALDEVEYCSTDDKGLTICVKRYDKYCLWEWEVEENAGT